MNLLQSETRLSDSYVTFRNRLKTELFKKSHDTWHWRHRCAPDSHATYIWARYKFRLCSRRKVSFDARDVSEGRFGEGASDR